MNAEGPSVAERLDREDVVSLITAFVGGRVESLLKVRIVADSVRRVDVDHLHLAAHAFVVQQRLDHLQRVATDQLVLPALSMGVELDALRAVGLTQRSLEIREERALPRFRLLLGRGLAGALDDLPDARLGDDLVTLEREHRYF